VRTVRVAPRGTRARVLSVAVAIGLMLALAPSTVLASVAPHAQRIGAIPTSVGLSPPSCTGIPLDVPVGGQATATLHCSDPFGLPFTIAIVQQPAHGTLSAIDQAAATVTYTATAGYSGPDSFSFQATNSSNEISDPAVVSVGVGLPVDQGGGAEPALIDLSSSPAGVIAWGQAVTLTAQIEANGAGRSLAFQASTDRITWSTIGTATTDATGAASLTYRPSDNRYYQAVFAGAIDLGAADSVPLRVVVRSLVLLRPTNNGAVRSITSGTSITFTVTARPNRPELPQAHANLVVERRTSSGYVIASSLVQAVDRTTGAASFRITFNTPGDYFVRAQLQPTSVNANSGFTPMERYHVS
jgi:hypothetical protein